MSDEQPENLVLHLLREIRSEMATKSELAGVKADLSSQIADLSSEMGSLRADVASDLHTLDAKIDATRKDLSEQIVGLRRAVIDYHSSVIGHGTLISDLEARLRRVEQRLGLEGH
jgi:outer membrane murein-binding lipoprotein Lpp